MKANYTTRCPLSPIKELLPINPGFYLTKEVFIPVNRNEIHYHPYLQHCSYKHIKRQSIRYGRTFVVPTDDLFPEKAIVYSNVAIVSTRYFKYNIYHFMETANMLVHYLLTPSIPRIKYVYFDDNVTLPYDAHWRFGYFDAIRHLFPKQQMPVLIPHATKSDLHFKNVLFLPLITDVEKTFISEMEVDFIRSSVYKSYNQSLTRKLSEPPLILFYNRTFRRSIVNRKELISTIKSFYPNVQSVMFDTMSFKQQVLVMMSVDVFVGVHGAQMTNILFLKPFSGVIEVFNPLFFMPCYQTIAQHSRLQYRAVQNTTIVRNNNDGSAWDANVNVDVYLESAVLMPILHQMVRNLHSSVCYKHAKIKVRHRSNGRQSSTSTDFARLAECYIARCTALGSSQTPLRPPRLHPPASCSPAVHP